MEQPTYLREQADRCRRLARIVSDSLTRQRLEQLAGEYEAKANARQADTPESEDVAVTRRAGTEQG